MSSGEHDVGSPGWYEVQFGHRKSYREMLFGPFDDEFYQREYERANWWR